MNRSTLFLFTAGALLVVALRLTNAAPAHHRPATAASGASLEARARLAGPSVLNGGASNYLSVELKGVDRARGPRRPVRLVAAVDRSGSMTGSKMDHAREAALHLIEQLTADDELGLVAYGSGVTTFAVRAASPGNKEEMRDFVRSLEPGGGTNIGLALNAAQALVAGRGPARVILLSDGQPTEGDTSTEGLKQVVRSLRERVVTVSAIGVGGDSDEALMGALAMAGGGFTGDLVDDSRLAEVFARELEQASTLVARDVDLFFDFPPTVTVEEVFGQQLDQQNGSAHVRLHDFSAGLSNQLIARLSVRCPEQGLVELGRVRVRYVDVASERLVEEELQLPAQVTSDAQRVMREADPEFLAQASRAAGAHYEALAANHYREGRADEGSQLLLRGAEALRAAFGDSASDIAHELEIDARRTTTSSKYLERKKAHDFGQHNGY